MASWTNCILSDKEMIKDEDLVPLLFFFTSFTPTIVERRYIMKTLLKVIFHVCMIGITGGLWLLGLIVYYLIK